MDENQYSKLPDIDINSSDFYDKLQDEIEFDIARLKKTVEVLSKLRLTAAEVEVETAALYHDELFHGIEEQECVADNFNELETIPEEELTEKSTLEEPIEETNII